MERYKSHRLSDGTWISGLFSHENIGLLDDFFVLGDEFEKWSKQALQADGEEVFCALVQKQHINPYCTFYTMYDEYKERFFERLKESGIEIPVFKTDANYSQHYKQLLSDKKMSNFDCFLNRVASI